MTACFLCSCYNFLVCCILTTKFDIIFNRIGKQIYSLKYKGKIVHQIVHAVILHIYTTKCHFAFIYVPESCDQITQCRFTTTRWTNDCCCCLFWNWKRYIVNNFSLVVGKRNVVKFNITILRLDFFSVNVHRIKLKNCICLIYAHAYHMQKWWVVSGTLKAWIQHECWYRHTDCINSTHCSVYIKCRAADHNDCSCNLRNYSLKKMIWHKQKLHLRVYLRTCFICII